MSRMSPRSGRREDDPISSQFDMDENELRFVIKYHVKKGLQPQEIFEEIKSVLGDNAPTLAFVEKWSGGLEQGASLDIVSESKQRLEESQRRGFL